jgi:hypothetical protein
MPTALRGHAEAPMPTQSRGHGTAWHPARREPLAASRYANNSSTARPEFSVRRSLRPLKKKVSCV